MKNLNFAERLIAWQKQHGRQNLPWQKNRDPYRIWVAEILLQQTRVASAIPYYERFLAAFPDLSALAAAPLDAVLAQWAGLGYYSRARNLHRAAQTLATENGGAMPREFDRLLALPGVGRSTAGAIAAVAYGERRAILDGNVKRVLARCFARSGYPGEAAVHRGLWELAESLLPLSQIETYTQALMDLGATLCTPRKPRCPSCPLAEDCAALATQRVAELPTPRPKRELPRRETRVLICRHQRETLLEQRPPQGIWGGLWSLPELLPEESLAQAMARRLPEARLASTRSLPAVKHSFTHFHLRLLPIVCELANRPCSAQSKAEAWFAPAELAKLGLPAPIARLLSANP